MRFNLTSHDIDLFGRVFTRSAKQLFFPSGEGKLIVRECLSGSPVAVTVECASLVESSGPSVALAAMRNLNEGPVEINDSSPIVPAYKGGVTPDVLVLPGALLREMLRFSLKAQIQSRRARNALPNVAICGMENQALVYTTDRSWMPMSLLQAYCPGKVECHIPRHTARLLFSLIGEGPVTIKSPSKPAGTMSEIISFEINHHSIRIESDIGSDVNLMKVFNLIGDSRESILRFTTSGKGLSDALTTPEMKKFRWRKLNNAHKPSTYPVKIEDNNTLDRLVNLSATNKKHKLIKTSIHATLNPGRPSLDRGYITTRRRYLILAGKLFKGAMEFKYNSQEQLVVVGEPGRPNQFVIFKPYSI